jgi:putative (di)nucleoside polyphosphate hydrolase
LSHVGSKGEYQTMGDVIDSDGFRENIGIVLARADGDVFLGRRSGGRGWQFPQGGIQRGEALEEALFRELREEIGLARADVTIAGRTARWVRYRLPARYVRRDRQPLCIGQKQRWFLLRLARADAAFTFDATDRPEFDQWRWAHLWDPVREVVYFKRPVYMRVLHELGRLLYPQGLPPYPPWWNEVVARPAAPAERAKPA